MNSLLRQFVAIATCGAVAFASPCLAQNAASEPQNGRAPVAKLVVFEGSRAAADWYGSGAIEVSAPLCIASSTGTFRLNLLPASGLAQLTEKINATISLEQDGALVSSQPFNGQAAVSFMGRVDPANLDCNGAGNARLILTLPEASLAGASAGQYFDQLQLQLEAI